MEHLVHFPDARTFRSEIRDLGKVISGVEDIEWLARHHKVAEAVGPRIRWLGYDHEASSHFFDKVGQSQDNEEPMDVFEAEYASDWDNLIECQDLRKVHSSLASLDDDEASDRITSFIQAWMSLGLLEAVCGTYIPTSLFLSCDDVKTNFLYTSWLPALLEWWKRSLSPRIASFFLARAQRCNLRAATIFQHFLKELKASHEPFARKLYGKLLIIEPGVSALHEFISDFIECHSHKSIRSFSASDSPVPRGYSQRLIDKGWCPFVIATAETNLSPSFLRFVDAAGYDLIDGGHNLCDKGICRRNQIDLATYAVQHQPSQCRCKFVKPDLGLIFDFLEDDYIPLVQYRPESKTLQVGALDPSDPAADYVVFSHVWADGLGSCSERGLPICQLERLHDLASRVLSPDVWFWIDGLCIPKREPYRNMAIQLMKYTYADSTLSIVLDNSIRRVSVVDDPISIAWYLYASGWMGRLWTYQEAFIPPRVDLELKDGLCQIDELVQRLYQMYLNNDKGNPVPAILAKDLVASLQKIRPLDRQFRQRDRVRQIVDVFNALTRRLTSRPEDQLLVLGLLLDIDLNKILAVDGELRWREFYLALREIPWTIVFDRRPKISKVLGFGWAPSTWISSGRDAYLHYDDTLAVCTEEGLHISLIVLLLDGLCKTSEGYLLVKVDSDIYEIRAPRETLGSSCPRAGSFEIIFVRYFKLNTPQGMLHGHPSLWMPAGVGQWDNTSSSEDGRLLWYDFQDGWEIRLVDEPDEFLREGRAPQVGLWMERDFLFT